MAQNCICKIIPTWSTPENQHGCSGRGHYRPGAPDGGPVHDQHRHPGCGQYTQTNQNVIKSGCELIRVAVPDGEAARALKGIVEKSPLPVIADIHFDYRLALEAMKAGAAGIRINPGNIGPGPRSFGSSKRPGDSGVCIRIGVNAGSLEKDLARDQEQIVRPRPWSLRPCAILPFRKAWFLQT